MKLESVKKNADVGLEGINAELVFEDRTLRKLWLFDSGGGSLVVEGSPYGGGIVVLRPSAPEMVKKYRLSGTIHGIEIAPQDFSERYEADNELSKVGYGGAEVQLTIEEIEVPEEE